MPVTIISATIEAVPSEAVRVGHNSGGYLGQVTFISNGLTGVETIPIEQQYSENSADFQPLIEESVPIVLSVANPAICISKPGIFRANKGATGLVSVAISTSLKP